MKKKLMLAFLAVGLVFVVASCGGKADQSAEKMQHISIGVVSGGEEDVWKDVATRLKKQDIILEIKKFEDYNLPNTAVSSGDLDMNGFQHLAFMENYNENVKKSDDKLVSIGYTYVSPLGLYSEKYQAVKDIPNGSQIAIPNDATNGGRALRLLAQIGFIELDESKESPTVNDITKNIKKIKLTELDASQTARTMGDVDASIVNTNYALDYGLNPYKDALYTDIEQVADFYKNIIAVRADKKDDATYKKVVAEYQSEATEKLLKKLTDGADVPAWK